MVEQHGFVISFPSLNYTNPQEGATSHAKLTESRVPRYSVGKHLTTRNTAQAIKSVLGAHGVSMTGRKEQLLDKLAQLSAKVYEEHEPELDDFFTKRRFIRVSSARKSVGQPFPVLKNLDFRNMVLTMYIIKHLRGNTILEATHNNDAFDLLSLANALIRQEVTLEGNFLRVE